MSRDNDLNDRQRRNTNDGGFSTAPSAPPTVGQHIERPSPNQRPPPNSWLTDLNQYIVMTEVESKQVSASNTNRNYLHLQNNSDTDIQLGFGVDAALNGYTVPSGGFLEFNVRVPMNAINIICSASDKELIILEGIRFN